MKQKMTQKQMIEQRRKVAKASKQFSMLEYAMIVLMLGAFILKSMGFIPEWGIQLTISFIAACNAFAAFNIYKVSYEEADKSKYKLFAIVAAVIAVLVLLNVVISLIF